MLVLNQNYEPISVTNTKKAIILLYLDKAEMIETNNGAVLHSISRNFPYPSVIRLHTAFRRPYKNIDLSRKNIFRRDGMQCQYCGKKNVQLTVDHIIPRSRGGTDTWENLATACVTCNNKKGNRTPEEAGMKLLAIPKKPNHLFFIKQNLNNEEDNWKPYLFI
ncbi:MAG TPA: HNH endonuclease [Candidatus Kapabacteria bacterium]|nr:HNH endonuclease [Candidatus Kapabacteria bacterium]